MIIDKNGKLFGKISIIDILIVAVIAALIIFAIVKLNTNSEEASPDYKTIEIVFVQNDAPDFAVDKINIGDYCYNVTEGGGYGYVTDIKTDDSIIYNTDSDGNVVLATNKYLKSVYITSEATGYMSQYGGAVIGDLTFYIGKTIEVRVGNTALYGKIYDINVKES